MAKRLPVLELSKPEFVPVLRSSDPNKAFAQALKKVDRVAMVETTTEIVFTMRKRPDPPKAQEK